MKYYFFNFTSKNNGEGYTVIFDYYQKILPQELSYEIKDFHTYNEQRRKSIYIYPETEDRSSETLKTQLGDVFNKHTDDIYLLPFNENGCREPEHGFLLSELYENGILNIIKSRSAVLESDDSFHYVLPSEKHSSFFIRTGNMLSDSSEVNFLALTILSRIKGKKINQIICDTSSILSLPYAINYLLSLFNKSLYIQISSFGSYENIDTFDFRPRSFIIISASNSGRLLKKIKAKQADIDSTTIIYNGEDPDGDVIFNMHDYIKSILSTENKKQYDTLKDCEYCKQNSIPVVVRGDQFIPSRIVIQKLLISKPNVPNWVKANVDSLLYHEAISCYRQEKLSSKRREIFIDIEKLLIENKSFQDGFNKYLRNDLPASTSLIIHLPDKSSIHLAKRISEYLQHIGSTPQVIDQNKISTIDSNQEHLILIVASCVTTGNKLNSISRDLRSFNKSSIHYLAVINRLSDIDKSEILRKNLEYRSDTNSNINRFKFIFESYLGDYHCDLYNEADKPSWANELFFWKSIKDKFQHPFFDKRIKELESKDGLVNNLFLPKPTETEHQPLKLRKNFAFHNIKDTNKISQADLYTIIAGTFHYLRYPRHTKIDLKNSGTEKYLIQHEHVKTIIDPVSFKRYNDGVIQASILRIANNSELNYSISDRESLDMLETLKDLFKDPTDTNLCEALLEFLLAIAIGKLKLKTYHLKDLLDFLRERYSNPSITTILIEVCKENIIARH